MTERQKLVEVFADAIRASSGRYLTKKEFFGGAGLSDADLNRLGFASYTELCDSVQPPIKAQNRPVSNEEVLSDWGHVARVVRGIPSVAQYRTHGKHSRNHLSRFGPYPKAISDAFVGHFANVADWADVVRVIQSAGRGAGRQVVPVSELAVRGPEAAPQSPGLASVDRFDAAAREDVGLMQASYAAVYCLERQMRHLVAETLEKSQGSNWWNGAVPTEIQENAKRSRQREEDSGVTVRSSKMIDYTTLGELGTIVERNWSAFTHVFRNQSALKRHMSTLNTLRAYIAHCTPLPADEVTRLNLAVSDWFRNLQT